MMMIHVSRLACHQICLSKVDTKGRIIARLRVQGPPLDGLDPLITL